jgi:hypothetical protein
MDDITIPDPPEVNIEDAFQDLFKTSASGSGEEELLRVASKYSLQIRAKQIRCLLFLEDRAATLQSKDASAAQRLRRFVSRWLELKEFNQSDVFVMKALEYVSLRKFLNENSFKVDIQK